MAKKALASKTGEVKYLQQGPIGPLVYPAGEYSASTGYTRTALSTPMVLCDGGRAARARGDPGAASKLVVPDAAAHEQRL